EVRTRLKLNTLRVERVVVKTEAGREHVDVVWLVRQARHIVGSGRVETAVEAGIRGAAEGKGILSEQAVGLAEQRVDGAGLIELSGVLQTVVGAAATFDAIPAGEFVNPE